MTASLRQVLAVRQSGEIMMPVLVETDQVIDQTVVLFASDSYGLLSVISSAPHQIWILARGLTLGKAPRYTPSDVFDTFPLPTISPALDDLGKLLESERREIMLRRTIGITQLYKRINDPQVDFRLDKDVERLRAIHTEIDVAVMSAYGWSDVPLNHGFHTYRQMTRWTVCPEARVEILDRLLEENHRRAVLQGEAAPAASDDDEGDDE